MSYHPDNEDESYHGLEKRSAEWGKRGGYYNVDWPRSGGKDYWKKGGYSGSYNPYRKYSGSGGYRGSGRYGSYGKGYNSGYKYGKQGYNKYYGNKYGYKGSYRRY